MKEDSKVGAAPGAALLGMISSYRVTQALHVAAKLGLADQLKEGPRHVDELAAATGAHPRAIHRLMRALASVGVFTEQAPETFGLTPMADLLRRDVPGSLHGQAVLVGEPWVWQVSGELLESVRTGAPSHARIFGVDIWQYLAQHPEAQAIFDAAMTSLSSLETDAIVAAYDFSERNKVVDVGGGEGALLAAILRAHSHIEGFLFDQPPVVASAKAFLAKAGLDARCKTIDGDMFAAVPPGGDLYLLKRVLHDWDDDKAVAILRACRAAMIDGARLVLAEPMIPPGDAPHPAKFLDLQMLVSQGGHERTAAQFASLLATAGFAIERIVPTRFLLMLVEARRT